MISICLIVKNESKYVDRLINSIKDVDDITIVDTGSTDDTREKIQKQGSVIPHVINLQTYEWKNDFSDARNYAQSFARHNWVMWLDADMYFPENYFSKVKEMLTKLPEDVDSVNFKLFDTASGVIWNSPRLIKKHVKFFGKVHECPDCKKTISTPFQIIHDRPDVDENTRDRFYQKTLLEAYEKDPTDLHALQYVISYELKDKNYKKARALIQKYLDQKDKPQLYYTLADLEREEKNYKKSDEHIFRFLQDIYNDPRAYIMLGDNANDTGEKLKALTYYTLAMSLPKEVIAMGITDVIDPELYDVVPLSNIAYIYDSVGQKDKAIECFKKALEINPRSKYLPTIQKNLKMLQQKPLNKLESKHPGVNLLTVVIPTMQKSMDTFYPMVETLTKMDLVKEVIVINNGSHPLSSFEKTRVVNEDFNIGVNPAWNEGMSMVSTPYYLIVNDDVTINKEAIESAVQLLEERKDYDIVRPITLKTMEEYSGALTKVNNSQVVYSENEYNEGEHVSGWFIAGRTKSWNPIPETLKIFFGDNWIYRNAGKYLEIANRVIFHKFCTTCNTLGEYTNGRLEEEHKLYKKELERETIAVRFNKLRQGPGNIYQHLDYLRSLVEKDDTVVELGVETGISSVAFLSGKPSKHYAIDINRIEEYVEMMEQAKREGLNTEYIIADDLTTEIPICDILFIDTFHTYEQLSAELSFHSRKVRRLIVMHDTTTFGEKGEDDSIPGLNQAIKVFLNSNLFWEESVRFTHNNGLTVLERNL